MGSTKGDRRLTTSLLRPVVEHSHDESDYNDPIQKPPDEDEMSSSSDDSSNIKLVTRDRPGVSKHRDSFIESTPQAYRCAGSQLQRSLHTQTGCTYSMGCRVITYITEPEQASFHDTACIIFRQVQSGDLILSFRGTLTPKQIKTDLMMTPRISVDLDKFLATTKPSKRKYLEKHGLFDNASIDALSEKLSRGEIKNIKELSSLLPRAEMDTLPDYLQNACNDGSDIHGIGNIHFGFWSSYNRVRRDIHRVVREELLRQPGRILVTGHSLGGALGTICLQEHLISLFQIRSGLFAMET